MKVLEFSPVDRWCPGCTRPIDKGHLVLYRRLLGEFQPTRVWCPRERLLTSITGELSRAP